MRHQQRKRPDLLMHLWPDSSPFPGGDFVTLEPFFIQLHKFSAFRIECGTQCIPTFNSRTQAWSILLDNGKQIRFPRGEFE